MLKNQNKQISAPDQTAAPAHAGEESPLDNAATAPEAPAQETTPATPATPANTEAPATESNPVQNVEKKNISQRLKTFLNGGGSDVQALKQEIASLKAANEGLRAEASAAQTELAEFNAALEALETENESLQSSAQSVTATVAALGFDPKATAALPAAENQDLESLDGLEAQLAASTDPKEKFTLAAKINKLQDEA